MSKRYSEEFCQRLAHLSYDNWMRLKHHNQKCGCYYCGHIFDSSVLDEETECTCFSDQSILCPACGIDSVISEEDGFTLTKEFLEDMSQIMFEEDHEE